MKLYCAFMFCRLNSQQMKFRRHLIRSGFSGLLMAEILNSVQYSCFVHTAPNTHFKWVSSNILCQLSQLKPTGVFGWHNRHVWLCSSVFILFLKCDENVLTQPVSVYAVYLFISIFIHYSVILYKKSNFSGWI